MQTFLPHSAPAFCAEALDNKRLNKQILECYQILNILSNQSPSGAWRNHPAVLMWKNAEWGLWEYVQACVVEADKRGIKTDKNVANLNALKEKASQLWSNGKPAFAKTKESINRTIVTHRANLYIKDPIYYLKYKDAVDNNYNKPCCDRCKYYWPTHVEAA
jgi:hypothetical protein